MQVPRYSAIRHPKQLRVCRRDVFCKLWTGLFYGLIYVHFISGALLTTFKAMPNWQLKNIQFVVVLLRAYFAFSGLLTRTGLPIPYVLPVIGEYSSTRGVRVYLYPRVYPTRPVPTARGYGSGRVDFSRVGSGTGTTSTGTGIPGFTRK